MRFNNIQFIFLIIAINSCVSMRNHELERVKEDSPVFQVASSINSLCFKENHPQFLADINSSNLRIPSFQLEAIWENKFDDLKGSVVGPLGEEYSSFEIKGNKIDYTYQVDTAMDNEGLNQITSLFATIGARGLRNFLCGGYAFQIENKNDGIFTKINSEEKKLQDMGLIKAPLHDKKQFLSISTLNISDNEVEVHNNLTLEKKGVGYSLIINSQFFYGPFSKESDVSVKWAGYSLVDNIYPTEVTFKIGADIYSVNITEYQ